jgi:hypothetical protein
MALALCLCLLGLCLALPLALAGCGESGADGASTPTVTRQVRLERTDLATVARGLLRVEPSVQRELVAARAAWPEIVGGLPAQVPVAARGLLLVGLRRTEQIATPSFISYAGELTGEAAPIAGLLLSYEQLARRGWGMTLAAAQHLSGHSRLPAATLEFLRTNAALYIGCVYDAHYNLSVIGERMREAYAQLGGAKGFGGVLPASLIARIGSFYSPAVARLAPKPAPTAAGR